MKRVCTNRLRQEAQKYSDLQSHISRLEESGCIAQLFDAVYSSCQQARQSREQPRQAQTSATEGSTRMATSKQAANSNTRTEGDQYTPGEEENFKDNLKLIMGLMVDDIWKNYDNYSLQKKVLEQSHMSAAAGIMSLSNINSSVKKGDGKGGNHDKTYFSGDFLEPASVNASQAQLYNVSNKEGRGTNQAKSEESFQAIDDSDEQSSNNSSIINPASLIEDKENIQLDINNQTKNGQIKQIFTYDNRTNSNNNLDANAIYYSQASQQEIANSGRRYTTDPSYQFKLQNESEFVFSQFQTPQYKQSEIGNPISSPHTDERETMFQQKQKELAKTKLLNMNLLSQENSAKDDITKKRQSRIGLVRANTGKGEDTLALDDIGFDLDQQVCTPQHENHQQHLQFANMTADREEIMLKNIWEIENNPIFSSGGSIGQETASPTLITSQNYERLYNQGYQSSNTGLNIIDEEFKESKLMMEGQGNTHLYFMNNDQDDSYIDDGASSSETDFRADAIKTGTVTGSDTGRNQAENLSESKAPVSSIEGPAARINYNSATGVQKKLNKLNLAQLQSHNNLLFQFGNGTDDMYNPTGNQLVMDQEYLNNIPRTGRDHYKTSQPPPLHPNNDKKLNQRATNYNTTQDTNSLMVSSEQPTKLSAEDVIRNYTNANFMPQKQPNDRLHLLCQSRELNPLVSLSVERADEEPKNGMTKRATTTNLMDPMKKLSYNRDDSSHVKTSVKSVGKSKIPKYINQSLMNNTGEGGNTTCASRSGSRSKTPIATRPATANTVATVSAKNHIKNQFYTQNQPLKKDDSVNDSKNMTAKNSKILKLVDESNGKVLHTQHEGRYIANKLAKVIKGKGSGVSRNQGAKQNATAPINLNHQNLSSNNNYQEAMLNHLSTMTATQSEAHILKNLDSYLTSKNIMPQNQTTTHANFNQRTPLGFNGQVAPSHFAKQGNQTTKYQQFTMSQRTDSQQSIRTTNSGGGLSQSKVNKFAMRRFTADPSDEQNKPLAQTQAQFNNSNILTIGQSCSSKNLSQTSSTNLPPSKKNTAYTSNGQVVSVSPKQLMKQIQRQLGESAGSSGSGKVGSKTLKEASSHKNIIQSSNSSSGQNIIYGKLIKKHQ